MLIKKTDQLGLLSFSLLIMKIRIVKNIKTRV